MESQKPTKQWTYDEVQSLPDGHRYEIFDGELFVDGQPYRPGMEHEVSPSPSRWHQELLRRLFRALDVAIQPTGGAKVYFAPLDVAVSSAQSVQPDLLVIAPIRKSTRNERGLGEVPQLVVEVLSKSTAMHDTVRKRRFYARIGVPEYWIVDPERETVQVLALIDGGLTYREAGWYASGDTARSGVFPIELDVTALFSDEDDSGDSDPTA